jgi:hypothetical protein
MPARRSAHEYLKQPRIIFLQTTLRRHLSLTLCHAPVEYYSLSFLKGGLQAAAQKWSLAEVAELADAHGSGPCARKGVGVRVPSSAPVIFSRLALSA